MPTIKNQAIQTALTGDWQTAITLNQEILQEEPDDIDTLNRLAFAFLSTGNPKEAKNVYEKVLSLDMQNPIAIRNLKRLHDVNTKKVNMTINNLFIEEPGKTKVMDLINIADKKVITHLRSGEKLDLRIKRSRIFAYDMENQFIGMLPDDLCQRLIKFIDAGNEYEAYVRTVDSNKVSIFIRETKRVKKFKNQPSFVSGAEKSKLSLPTNGKAKSHRDDSSDDDE
ncbi:MAG TPA: tetratricopeptide repeat protein [Candidatus Saccharimonadales bacterium]|nr:tetratricopeptide repeat protein [Candidatus Saccharimonadales bacterium]